jgi:hypothetical protein
MGEANGGEAMSALARVERFPFDGDELDVVPGEGQAHVVIKRVCEALGVAFQRQLVKLRSDPAAVITMMVTTGPDGKTYRTACIDLRALPLWLAGIHLSKVKPAVRPKLLRYKRECADVLADHFLGKRRTMPEPAPVTATVDDARLRLLEERTNVLATALLKSSQGAPPTSEQRLVALNVLVGEAVATGRLSVAREILNAAQKLIGAPDDVALEQDGDARQAKPRITPEHNQERVLAFVREANSSGRGPTVREICDSVRGGTGRISRAIRDLLKAKALEDRGTGRRGRNQGARLWIADAPVAEAEAAQLVGRSRPMSHSGGNPPRAGTASPQAVAVAEKGRAARRRGLGRTDGEPAPSRPRPASPPAAGADALRNTLVRMGYRSGQAGRAVAELGDRVGNERLEDSLRAALALLTK